MFPAVTLVFLLSGLILPPVLVAAAEPELPRVYIDTTYVPPKGRVIAMASGGDFQAALVAARPGDVITLTAGATYRGPFSLPNKTSGSGWITVRTSTPDGSVPPPGTRVTTAQAPLMPKVVAASGSVITTAPPAHHHWFMGVEISPALGTSVYDLIVLGLPAQFRAGDYLVPDRNRPQSAHALWTKIGESHRP